MVTVMYNDKLLFWDKFMKREVSFRYIEFVFYSEFWPKMYIPSGLGQIWVL